MSNINHSSNGGIGFFGLLTVLFIGLKLTGYINWSWFWVLFPVISVFSFVIIFLIFIVLINIK